MDVTRKYAIIEIGSNTIRLIIYQVNKDGKLKKLENRKTTARLHNYLSEGNRLEQAGVTLLVETLQQYASIIRQYQLETTVCVATGVLRSAHNRQAVLDQIRQHTGFAVQILSAYDEAYYAYLAVIGSTAYTSGIIMDVGGGSTEISSVKNRRLQHYHSFPFGALTLKQWFVSGSKPDDDEYQTMQAFVARQLASLDWLADCREPIIGVGGNAHNVVRIHQAQNGKKTTKLHKCQLPQQAIDEVLVYLQSMTPAELPNVTGLAPKRAPLILPALAVFQSLLDLTGAQQFILSRKGVRDGLLYELLMSD